MVVWYHCLSALGNTNPTIPRMSPLNVDLGHIGVSIFFFISGLLVTNSIITKRRVLPFIFSRFYRIYPAYLVMLLLCTFVIGPIFTNIGIIEYLKHPLTWEYFLNTAILNIKDTLPGLWENHPFQVVNGSLWTIPFEVTCYIIVLATFILYNKLRLNYWIVISCALIMAILPQSITWNTLGISWIFFNRGQLFCFIIGTLFAIYKDKVKIDSTLIYILILLCTLLYRWQNVIYFLFPITIAITLLYCSTTDLIKKIKLPHDISYGVYIIHFPVIQIIFATTNISSWLICFLITSIITIPLAILSAKYIEEPALRFSKKITLTQISMYSNPLLILGILILGILIAKFCY